MKLPTLTLKPGESHAASIDVATLREGCLRQPQKVGRYAVEAVFVYGLLLLEAGRVVPYFPIHDSICVTSDSTSKGLRNKQQAPRLAAHSSLA